MRASRDLERQIVCSTMRSMSLCVKGVQIWNSQSDNKKWLILLLHLNVNAIIFYLRHIWLWTSFLTYIMCKDVYLFYTLNMNLKPLFKCVSRINLHKCQ